MSDTQLEDEEKAIQQQKQEDLFKKEVEKRLSDVERRLRYLEQYQQVQQRGE